MSGLGLSGRADDLFDPLSAGQYRGRREVQLVLRRRHQRRRRPRSRTARPRSFRCREGDRLAQARNPYSANQQILANKQLRWWWNNPHYAVYDDGDGAAGSRRGRKPSGSPNSKPIVFLEYGVPAVDKGDQPAERLLFDPTSTESATPYWSIWQPTPGGGYLPLRDDTISTLALEAIYQYWLTGANNETVGGVAMMQLAFCCVWNWDARPFPGLPDPGERMGRRGRLAGRRLAQRPRPGAAAGRAIAAADAGNLSELPALATLGWSTHVKPRFATDVADHVSGRSTRAPRYARRLLRRRTDLRGAALGRRRTPNCRRSPASSSRCRARTTPSGSRRRASPASGQALGTGDGATTSFRCDARWRLLRRARAGSVGRLGGLSQRRRQSRRRLVRHARATRRRSSSRRRRRGRRGDGRFRRALALPLRRRRRSTSRSSWRCCSSCRSSNCARRRRDEVVAA